MRRLGLVLVLTSTVAFADKPVRKAAPPDLPQDRLSYFVNAIIHDKAGELDDAVNDYRTAANGKDYAAIIYNLADLHRRREDWDDAIKSYKKYLELLPNASDRAAVQKLVTKLEKTPTTLVVDGEDLDGVVFINGKPAGASPLVTTLPEGRHVVDRIGPTTFIHTAVYAKPLRHEHVTGRREVQGNVVISSSSTHSGSWRDGDILYRMHDRFTLAPGRYDTYYFDPGRACSPISFQVPADGLVYVFIEAPERKQGGCIPIKVTAQKISFPKGKS